MAQLRNTTEDLLSQLTTGMASTTASQANATSIATTSYIQEIHRAFSIPQEARHLYSTIQPSTPGLSQDIFGDFSVSSRDILNQQFSRSTPRDRYTVLYLKEDGGRIPRRHNTRTIRYRELYRKAMTQEFEDLHLIFPTPDRDTVMVRTTAYDADPLIDIEDASLTSRRALTFSFDSPNILDKVLRIRNTPALVFTSITNTILGLGEVREVHLHKILPVKTNEEEKLKRLFLRHMGFHCIRHKNKMELGTRKGAQIVDPQKGFTFKNQWTMETSEFTHIVTNEFTRLSIVEKRKR